MKSFLSTVAFFLLSTAISVAQCPMCKNVAMSAQRETGRGTTLNDGIAYLFVIPYLCLITVGLLWYRAYKKKAAAGNVEE